MVFTKNGDQVIEMTHHQFEWDLGKHSAIGSQECGREIEPNHASAVPYGAELVVCQVARMPADRMGIGMRCNQRCG